MLKTDFAKQFYQVDLRTLMRWIKANKTLLEALEATGYKKHNKVFTPLQIKIIREHLG